MQRTKVLFIGLDSADPRLLAGWAEQGLLPSLSTLLRDSLRGKARMPAGLGTGAMWTSLCNGVSPAKHGRYFGRQPRANAYKVEKFDPSEMHSEPIWSAASRQGKRVAIIDVPVAPLCEQLVGIQIKDWGTHDPVFAEVRTVPRELAAEVRSRFGVDPVGSCDAVMEGALDYRRFRDRLIQRVAKKADLACHYLEQGGWDLFMVIFADAHCVGHQGWHLHDVNHPLHDPSYNESFGDPVKDVYIALDAAIGELLSGIDPGTTVVLFAGSGMGPNYTGNHLLDEVLRRLEGVAPAPTRKAVEAVRHVYRRVLPASVRAWLGPFADRVDESSLVADRARRKFYAIPHNDLSGAIRFNIAGREPSGQLRPGAECESICAQLRRELLELVNPDTGKPVVDKVLKTSEVFEGAETNPLPDLLVVWNREGPIAALSSPKIGEVRGVRLSRRTGDHMPEAMLYARGPKISAGDLSEAVAVERIAPTMAALLGIALPNVDGQPIAEIAAPRNPL